MLVFMKTPSLSRIVSGLLPILALVLAGCDAPPRSEKTETPPAITERENPANRPLIVSTNPASPGPIEVEATTTPRREEEEPASSTEAESEISPENPPPIPEGAKALNKQKTLFFEKSADDKRLVHILAEVCLREGALEVFLCKKNTKEHEAILNVDLDAREIHFALIAAGAKPGSTVKFVPVYKPATGDKIKVTLTYHLAGKLQRQSAQSWILDTKTKKDMPHDWVFAGSGFFKNPENPEKPPHYYANSGAIICIANFAESMMDLPVKSSKEQSELGFVANTERIPPLKTKVLVTLEVVTKRN